MSEKISKISNFKTISILCLVVFVLDRILKYLAWHGKIFLQKNYGLLFSLRIPENLSLIFIFLIFILWIFIIYFLLKFIREKKILLVMSCWLLVVGCASNLIDRIKFGFIIDYFNFGIFYNNLADIIICLGVLILIYSLVFSSSSRADPPKFFL